LVRREAAPIDNIGATSGARSQSSAWQLPDA